MANNFPALRRVRIYEQSAPDFEEALQVQTPAREPIFTAILLVILLIGGLVYWRVFGQADGLQEGLLIASSQLKASIALALFISTSLTLVLYRMIFDAHLRKTWMKLISIAGCAFAFYVGVPTTLAWTDVPNQMVLNQVYYYCRTDQSGELCRNSVQMLLSLSIERRAEVRTELERVLGMSTLLCPQDRKFLSRVERAL